MTAEYGAASQLEKIDMLDLASLVVLNKFDRRGGDDALRDVRKQWRRNRVAFTLSDDEVPVYPTIASRYGDPGVTRVATSLVGMLESRTRLGRLARAGGRRGRRPGRVDADPRCARQLPGRDRRGRARGGGADRGARPLRRRGTAAGGGARGARLGGAGGACASFATRPSRSSRASRSRSCGRGTSGSPRCARRSTPTTSAAQPSPARTTARR